MSGKSFAIGEAGIIITNSKEILDRAIVFGHYERHGLIDTASLMNGIGLPWGGYKNRMHQMSSAIGIIQVKFFPEQEKETNKAMNYFWDLLEGVPGIKAHRPAKGSDCTKGGWYFPLGHYVPEELEGLSVTRFCEAVRAEGVPGCGPGCNKALHTHPLFNTLDVYNAGMPTRNANSTYDVAKAQGSLPVTDGIQERIYLIPRFINYRPEIIKEYASAYKKVAENYKELIPGDKGNPVELGGWRKAFTASVFSFDTAVIRGVHPVESARLGSAPARIKEFMTSTLFWYIAKSRAVSS
jgi:dTDP-4-amino-4,6-dideoxygalactose transaminase